MRNKFNEQLPPLVIHPNLDKFRRTEIQLMQEPRDDGLLRLRNVKRKWKAATQAKASSRSSNGHNKIQNSCPAKDKLSVTCSEEGHNSHDCPMKDRKEKCTTCNKVGHCYLQCCRQHVSENHACRRCGEKGHYASKGPMHCGDKFIYTGLSCSSCDTNHLLGRCPMNNITCFLCEGKDHVPAQCHLSPILTAVNQHLRESFRGTLKERRTVTELNPPSRIELYDDSRQCQLNGNNEMAPKVSSCRLGEPVNRDGESPIISNIPASEGTSAEAMTDVAQTKVLAVTCFNCHDEGHRARNCPKKNAPRKLPLRCGVTCLNCNGNHYTIRCPKERPGKLKLCNVTCLRCGDKGHFADRCPKMQQPRKLEPYDESHGHQL